MDCNNLSVSQGSDVVEIWTDGGCKPNPGPGGWGVLLRYRGKERELSGGEKQRVNILRAILKNANLNLYDEPFTGLDLSLKYKVASIIKNETSYNGKTSIIVTHDVAVAVDLADEIIFIDNGKVENYTAYKINGELSNEEKLNLITKISNRFKN